MVVYRSFMLSKYVQEIFCFVFLCITHASFLDNSNLFSIYEVLGEEVSLQEIIDLHTDYYIHIRIRM